MSLKEHVYSILIVSAIESFNYALTSLLSESVYHTVQTVSSISAAKRATAERTFDFIVINSPLPDDIGTRFAIDSCSSTETITLFVVKNDIYSDMYAKVAERGVFLLAKPTSKQVLAEALHWMIITRARLRRLEKKSLSIEEKMAEIRLVNKAKWLLISELKMSEPDAHRYIEKQAMDNCTSKKSIAENIIKTYS